MGSSVLRGCDGHGDFGRGVPGMGTDRSNRLFARLTSRF
jgi:hypothetical protein